MARQTSHVIVQPRPPPARKKPARPRDPVASGERDAAHNRTASHNYFLLEKFEAGVSPARHRGQVHPRGQGQPQGLLRPHQERRGVSAQPAYRSLLPRQHRQPRRHPHPQAAAAPRRGSQATLQDADQGPHAHPHPALLPQRPGQVRAGRGQGQAGLGQARDRERAARPTAMPAPPSTPASTGWGASAASRPGAQRITSTSISRLRFFQALSVV